MFRRCRHAAHDHPWAVVALNEWQRCAGELLGKHRARPTAIRVSAGGPPTVQIRAARGGATACMWPCGPARAFRRGARPVHGAARPPTAGRAQDRPDPPQNRPAGAQTRWPWLGSSAASGLESVAPNSSPSWLEVGESSSSYPRSGASSGEVGWEQKLLMDTPRLRLKDLTEKTMKEKE